MDVANRSPRLASPHIPGQLCNRPARYRTHYSDPITPSDDSKRVMDGSVSSLDKPLPGSHSCHYETQTLSHGHFVEGVVPSFFHPRLGSLSPDKESFFIRPTPRSPSDGTSLPPPVSSSRTLTQTGPRLLNGSCPPRYTRYRLLPTYGPRPRLNTNGTQNRYTRMMVTPMDA